MIDLANLQTLLSFVLSIISILSVIYLVGVKIAKIEVKVDTMWQFQIRRAFVEAIDKDIGRVGSSLKLLSEHIERLEPFREELQNRWAKDWHKKKSLEVVLDIEREFGDRLFHHVCIPCGLAHGACLILALGVCQDKDVVDLP